MLERLGWTLVIALACVQAQSAIPDTPAGQALRTWLEAFNSGDRERIAAYVQKYEPNMGVDATMSFRSQTGGFDLLSIDSSESRRVQFRVKEKNRPTTAIGRIDMKDGDPPRIGNFSLRAIPPGAKLVDVKLDAAWRSRVIEGVANKLNEYYVFPDKAAQMGEAVTARQRRGEYDSVTDGETFATMLTDHLREISKDKHLRVTFSPFIVPERPEPAEAKPGIPEQMRTQMERMNCGFERVEHMSPNIGYVKFNMFANPDVCGPTATAAMNFLGNVDAVIFDLRDNGGGDPKMVAFVSSYLFGERTHLNDLYNRKEDKTTEYWTQDVPGKRLAGKPAFVLTSKRTFSGAEEFSYNLKNLKRATIIGETTGGGAHPVSGHRIDEHFGIGVPYARAINPVSKSNWEGTGVEPDVRVPAGEALDAAKKMAAEQIRKK
jgi:hypothetical protein